MCQILKKEKKPYASLLFCVPLKLYLLTLREELRVRVLENKVMRKILVFKGK